VIGGGKEECVGCCHEAGVDIVTVQKLAGHASPVTTAKYDRRGKEALATGGAAFGVLGKSQGEDICD